jgi:hypothetical protein
MTVVQPAFISKRYSLVDGDQEKKDRKRQTG